MAETMTELFQDTDIPKTTPLVATMTTAEMRAQIEHCKAQIQTKHREIVMNEGAIQILQMMVEKVENIAAYKALGEALAKAAAEKQSVEVVEETPAEDHEFHDAASGKETT